MEPILQTEALSVGYSGKALLSGIEISVRAGEILTLIGPNGAGKSTILKTLTRQLEPIGGLVWLENRPMGEMKENQVARTMSIVMTTPMEPELMTCGEVVCSGRYPYTGRLGLLSQEDRRKAAEAMEQVNVADLADRDFNRISDGQRQRVLLARAICQEPKVLVMDEPTSFLDIRHKLELLALLKELVRRRQLAVILSLHELDLAQLVSDRILCIREGAVDRCGTPEEIFTGGYIQRLYGVRSGTFHEEFGSLELEPVRGEPQVFVIGGGGTGISVYRKLQREGIPFAAGVLHENDVDWPVATALAAEVIGERAFEPVSLQALNRALEQLKKCRKLICCLRSFGTMNRNNEKLLEFAREQGIEIEQPQGI